MFGVTVGCVLNLHYRRSVAVIFVYSVFKEEQLMKKYIKEIGLRLKYWWCRLTIRNRAGGGQLCQGSLYLINLWKHDCYHCPYSLMNNLEKDWLLDDVKLEYELKERFAQVEIRRLNRYLNSLQYLNKLMKKKEG